MNFEQAKAAYVHRFTMEHVPAWAARRPRDDGGTATWFYAPQYRTDKEWFENTLFPPSNPFHKKDCHSSNQSWPLGQHLDAPYKRSLQ